MKLKSFDGVELAETKKSVIIKSLTGEVNRLRSIILAQDSEKSRKVPCKEGNTIRFGVMSDPHFGSRYDRMELVHEFYKTLKSEGIQVVLCPGDILDGFKVYAGQEFELRDFGWGAQLEFAQRNRPSVRQYGIKTYYITGNHDLSFHKNSGINVLKELEDESAGWIGFGNEYGMVEFRTESGRIYKVAMLHPGGGTSYAVSYQAQKIIESLSGGKKPHMAVIGHFHKALHMPMYRNVSAILPGTFQSQTPFMQRHHLAAHVGGWIIEVTAGSLKELSGRIKAEFIPFYERGE
jgi:predicted phosphodiesterase